MTRIEQLEAQIAQLQDEIVRLKNDKKRSAWRTISQASDLLKCNAEVLRRHIRAAKANPKSSRFKKGVHWREKNNTRYEINIETWLNRSIKN